MKTIGDRVTYCRSALNLTRKELEHRWKEASVPTIARWELDTVQPSSKKIQLLSGFFCENGLIVAPEWIEFGTGIPPTLLNMKEFREDQFDDLCQQNFLELHQKIKDFTYYKVTSNFFMPVIRYGDYVGGIKINSNPEGHLNSLVFVVHQNTVYAGLLAYENELCIKNPTGQKFNIDNYDLLAKIQWTAIRP
ncbi:MAG: hypothetical protein ACHP65_06130 [Legionellales bacterium]